MATKQRLVIDHGTLSPECFTDGSTSSFLSRIFGIKYTEADLKNAEADVKKAQAEMEYWLEQVDFYTRQNDPDPYDEVRAEEQYEKCRKTLAKAKEKLEEIKNSLDTP